MSVDNQINFIIVTAETNDEYQALLEVLPTKEEYKDSDVYCLVKEDNAIYFNGKRTSIVVEVIKSYDEDFGVHMNTNSLKFIFPDSTEFVLENADVALPEAKEILSEDYVYPTVSYSDEPLILHDVVEEKDLYNNGLMSAFDKYRLNVLWSMADGQVTDKQYFVHQHHKYDLIVASIEQGDVEIEDVDTENIPLKDIPVFFRVDEKGNSSWGYWVLDPNYEDTDKENASDYFIYKDILRKNYSFDRKGVADDNMITQEWVTVDEADRKILSISAQTRDFTEALYKPGVPLDTFMTRPHGALPAGTTAVDLVNNQKTISHVLDAILYDKITVEKISEMSPIRLEPIEGYDPQSEIVPGTASYPTWEQMDIVWSSEEKWALKYTDGSVVADEFVVDLKELYEVEENMWMYDGNHAVHPLHYHIHEDPNDLIFLNYRLDAEYYREHVEDVVKENDRCIFYGVLHLTPKYPDGYTITGPDGEEYTIPGEEMKERWYYTENAWYLGTYYNNDPYWRPLATAPIEDVKTYEDYPASLLQRDATLDECPKADRWYFNDMYVFTTTSPVYANVNAADASINSLYQFKNQEPFSYVEFSDEPGKLTNTHISVSDNPTFYLKWPSGTKSNEPFVVCIPNGYKIDYVGSAHDTYDEKYTVETHATLDSSTFEAYNVQVGGNEVAPVLYNKYIISKAPGITTVQINVSEETED